MAVSLRPARVTRRIATALTGFAALFAAACAGEKPASPVLPESPVVTQFKPLSFIADVDTRTRSVRITAPSVSTANAPTLSIGGVEAPALSLLGGEAVRIVPIAGSYNASLPGAFEPNRIRVTFNVLIENKLPGISFITPTWPVAPAAGVILFPLDYAVTTTSGGVTGGDGNEVIVELPSRGQVTSSPEWDGAPYSFFNDADCSLATSNDCFRWQAFDAAILPQSTSRIETIGFDMDASVGQFRVRMIAAADLAPAGPIVPGTVAGSVTSPVRGALENVTVSVSGNGSDATDATGAYSVGGVNPGTRTVSVSNLPAGCSAVADQSVSVASGATTTANFSVTCTGLPGVIGGIVTRDYDGAPLANVTVTSSTGGSDVTDAAGAYSIAGVAAGAGTLSIGAVAGETCSPLAPVAYSLPSGGTVTSDIVVDCQAPLAPGYQYNTTWTALPGNQVQLDIRVDMRTFDNAAITNVTTGGALGGTGDPLVGIQLSFTYDASRLTFVEEQTALMGAPRISSGPTVNGGVAGQVSLLTGTVGTTFFTGNVAVARIIFDRVPGATGSVGTTTTITAANSRSGGVNQSILANIVNTEGTFVLP
ncbi:MAG: carboxypeptidase regulatory-like domain-containing protein [Gemmatimonadaceae bacterium]|nr:carboxypeptidase regulatory-like domain-containing protein [Gemmatimonadaceae bacterium]